MIAAFYEEIALLVQELDTDTTDTSSAKDTQQHCDLFPERMCAYSVEAAVQLMAGRSYRQEPAAR
jgi:hypothetical protein